MDFATKNEFVDVLLKCPAMRGRNTRNSIVDRLPEVRDRITRSDIARPDVANIVYRSLDYTGGFSQLIEALRFYEGNSIHMQRIDALWNKYGTSFNALPDGKDTVDTKRDKSRWMRIITHAIILCCFLSNLVLLCLIINRLDEIHNHYPSTPTITVAPVENEYILTVKLLLGDSISLTECKEKISNNIRSLFAEIDNIDSFTSCNEHLDGNEKNKSDQKLILYKAEISIWHESSSYDMDIFIHLDGYSTTSLNPKPDNRYEITVNNSIFIILLALVQSEYDRNEATNAIQLFEAAIERTPREIPIELKATYCDMGDFLSKINNTDSMIDGFKKICAK